MSKRWATKMRTLYITGFLLIILAIVTPGIYKALTPPLTCNDGIMNQTETAPDLGGPCKYRNPADLKPLLVKWTRSFRVVRGLYNSVAYVENPNPRSGVRKLQYRFTLYDEDNVPLAERIGSMFVPPGKVVPIFEGNMYTGEMDIHHTVFEFGERIIWERMDPELATEIVVFDKSFIQVGDSYRLTATVENRSVYTLHNLVVVAVLVDDAGNAVGASRTIVEIISPDTKKHIVFTWPKSLDGLVVYTDVVPLLPPIDALD
jgi:hypothetical protein